MFRWRGCPGDRCHAFSLGALWLVFDWFRWAASLFLSHGVVFGTLRPCFSRGVFVRSKALSDSRWGCSPIRQELLRDDECACLVWAEEDQGRGRKSRKAGWRWAAPQLSRRMRLNMLKAPSIQNNISSVVRTLCFPVSFRLALLLFLYILTGMLFTTYDRQAGLRN
ncbi:hypothetical protein DPEC_G00019170 [Dallia pectoralis]|uniref:Uncharacterized protein n=1 Tax=Dallia pectoralis TaxID=75939 RepID=A0ACC2HGI4_DALPE|nr:hypothetical protein DPEC_G00019170 [Dallia pectoralis]